MSADIEAMSTAERLWLILAVIVSIVVSIPLGAFTVSTLWLWFVVPLGLAAIGWAHAYGLATLAFFLVKTGGTKKSDDERGAWERVGHVYAIVIGRPAGALVCGYVCHWLMQ